jgi:uncharacterized protein YjbI with pentapeptide repeats
MDLFDPHQFEYEDDIFEKVMDTGGTVEDNQFIGCTFSHCRFTQTVFMNCRFRECIFQDCELQVVRFPRSSFSMAEFQDCSTIGINWSEAEWPSRPLLNLIHFNGCVLNYSTFIGLSLPGIRIKNCQALDVDFSEAGLNGADFSDTDLSRSRFQHTDLTVADFRSARNYTLSPTENKLKGARFTLPEAMSLLYGLDIILDE